MPNQLGLDSFDLEDALGKAENHLCSPDLKEFIEKYHLDLSFDGKINPRDAFGSHSDADHIYNTPRAWILQRYFNPTTASYDGIDADFRPDDDDLPWARIPERKITIEDIKYALSHHFQGTIYDPYKNHGDKSMAGAFRPIGINRNNFLGLTQIRSDKPEAIKAIEWLALGSNVFNAMAPFYVNITDTPSYLRDTTGRVTTESFYWINRIIAALADPYFADTSNLIERYQEKIGSFAWEMIYKTDEKIIKDNISKENSVEILEKTNEQIAGMLKKESDDLLDQVLIVASNKMKNSFSRSDA